MPVDYSGKAPDKKVLIYLQREKKRGSKILFTVKIKLMLTR